MIRDAAPDWRTIPSAAATDRGTWKSIAKALELDIDAYSAGRFSTKWRDIESTFCQYSRRKQQASRFVFSIFFVLFLCIRGMHNRETHQQKKKVRVRVVREPHEQHTSYSPDLREAEI